MVVEQPLDGNYTGAFGEEASSSDLEQSSGSILPDDQVRDSRATGFFNLFMIVAKLYRHSH